MWPCSMVSINQRNGARSYEPMLSLAAFRAEQRAAVAAAAAAEDGGSSPGSGGGGVTFGVLFNVEQTADTTAAAITASPDSLHAQEFNWVAAVGAAGAGAAAAMGSTYGAALGSVEWMRERWGTAAVLSVGDGVFLS